MLSGFMESHVIAVSLKTNYLKVMLMRLVIIHGASLPIGQIVVTSRLRYLLALYFLNKEQICTPEFYYYNLEIFRH